MSQKQTAGKKCANAPIKAGKTREHELNFDTMSLLVFDMSRKSLIQKLHRDERCFPRLRHEDGGQHHCQLVPPSSLRCSLLTFTGVEGDSGLGGGRQC